MKIACTVGHSVLRNGNTTSANGTNKGGVNEYQWCKKFVPLLVEVFNYQDDCEAVLIQCPEKKFAKAYEEKKYKLDIVNKGGFDLVIESHLNAHNGSAKGTETLYCEGSTKGKAIAQRVNDKLDDIFGDRGIKARNDLYILTQSKPVAILNEYFFCDSKEDYAKADSLEEMQLIALKTVEGVIGRPPKNPFKKGVANPTESKPQPQRLNLKNGSYNRKVRVLEPLNVRKERGNLNQEPLKQLKKGDIVEIWYVLNNWASIQCVHPQAKDNTGYINCSYVEFV